MEFYSVKLNKEMDDIEKVDEFNTNLSKIYFLSNVNYEFKNDLSNEQLIFVFNGANLSKDKNKIFNKIKHIDKNIRKMIGEEFKVIVFNSNGENEKDVFDLIRAIKIVLLKRKIDRYEYIYDVACNYLDNEFITKNICDFKNDKCFAKRDFNCTCGCCRHFKHFFSNKLVQCEYLIDKHCSAKCLPCKMFTCDEIIKRKNIKYRFKDIFLLDKFFNPIQKIVILMNCFNKKETIIKRLLWFGF